jgi:uncharacterized membrane protein YfhO
MKKHVKSGFSLSDRDKNIMARRLSFFIPVIVMLCLFIANGIYPFGDRSFLFSDMYHQYLPFFAEFIRKIKAGDGLFYSYNVGIGSNFMALYVYYLASPLNWLGLLVPQRFLIEFMSYLVIVRIGLCGLTSFIYLQKHFEENNPSVLAFSCLYALSGYIAAYNWNVMWLDCIILFPLIMLGTERLVKEGKCGLYCISLALSILTNYYISIMICIFLVIYFVVLLITEKRSVRIAADFVICSILAGGMAAILLIPEICAIISTEFAGGSFPTELTAYFSIFDELARHCIFVTTERGLEHWPNIYCGAAVFLLIPIYVTNSAIPIKKRFCNMIMASIFLVSFSLNMTDYVWHGFNYPDSLPARQSFIYIFIVLVMCCDAFLNIRFVPAKNILYGYLCAAVFLLFCDKFVDSEDFGTGIVLLTLLFVTVYAVLLYIIRTGQTAARINTAALLALVTVIAELTANMANTSVGTVSRSDYIGDVQDYNALYEYAEEISPYTFFRIEKFSRKTKNDSTLAAYPSASLFSSTMNSSVMNMYKRLGMRYSKVFYGYDGATPLVAALLNVEYMFGSIEDYSCTLYEKSEKSGKIDLYKSAYTLPFGYVAPYEFDMPDDMTGVRLQNGIVNELGVEGKLLESVKKTVTGDNIRITAEKDGEYYAVISASGTKKVELAGGSMGNTTYSDLKTGSIIYLGYLYKGDSVTIINADDDDDTPKVSADGYILNEDVLQNVIDILGENHLENAELDSTHISGTLSLKNAGRIILSIPYEKGWTITVNGNKTEPQTFGGSLIALDLEAGEYEISMKYVPQGLFVGAAVSLISLLLFLLFIIIKIKLNHRGEY